MARLKTPIQLRGAQLELLQMVGEWQRRHNLTTAERARLYADLVAETLNEAIITEPLSESDEVQAKENARRTMNRAPE